MADKVFRQNKSFSPGETRAGSSRAPDDFYTCSPPSVDHETTTIAPAAAATDSVVAVEVEAATAGHDILQSDTHVTVPNAQDAIDDDDDNGGGDFPAHGRHADRLRRRCRRRRLAPSSSLLTTAK